MQEVVIPDILNLIEKHKLPREFYAPDGTLIYKPYDPAVESPLLVNRKNWRLFANYVPVESKPDEDTWIARINTTGQLVEIHDNDLARMLRIIRLENPGATVEQVVNKALAEVEEETGEFKDDNELIGYAMYLYTALAFAIAYGLLVVVE